MKAQKLFEHLLNMDALDRESAEVVFEVSTGDRDHGSVTYEVALIEEVYCDDDCDTDDEEHSCVMTELRLS